MTRKEAREKAKEILEEATREEDSVSYVTSADEEWLKMAIKALEQEPCDNSVSRQAVNTLIDELARAISDERCCISRGRSTATIMRDILHLPPVTPQPKIGHWIEEIDDYGKVKGWHCDKCYEDSGFTTTCKWGFCPSCGAKMIDPQESEK